MLWKKLVVQLHYTPVLPGKSQIMAQIPEAQPGWGLWASKASRFVDEIDEIWGKFLLCALTREKGQQALQMLLASSY